MEDGYLWYGGWLPVVLRMEDARMVTCSMEDD